TRFNKADMGVPLRELEEHPIGRIHPFEGGLLGSGSRKPMSPYCRTQPSISDKRKCAATVSYLTRDSPDDAYSQVSWGPFNVGGTHDRRLKAPHTLHSRYDSSRGMGKVL